MAEDPFDLRLPRDRSVPAGELTWRATTSGGPGGQHANRTASRVEIVVRIDQLPLDAREQARLWERLAARIVGSGELVVGCADHRQQSRNRQVATRRMERLIADALREEKRRVPTKKSYGAKLRARSAKQQQSQRKHGRSWQPGDDE